MSDHAGSGAGNLTLAAVLPKLSAVRRLLSLPVPLLVLIGAVLAACGAAGALFGMRDSDAVNPDITSTLALAFVPLAIFVVRRLPRHAMGRLMLLVGGSAYVAAASSNWSVLPAAAWLSQWAWAPAVAVIPVLLLLVPDGTLPSRRWRPLLAVLIVSGAVMTVALAEAALARPRTLLKLDPDLPTVPGLLLTVALGAFAVQLLATLGVLSALLRRWVLADPPARRQLECLLPSAALLLVGVVLDVAEVPFGWLPVAVAFPIGLTLAVLRYQLHDLDLYIHRGAVWFVITGLVVATYVGVATVLGTTVLDPGSTWVSVLAAAAVAALLQPAQWVAQRAVRRLLYGRRDEPYAVITELGRHLEAVRDPLAVLPEIAATIVDGLRVPYAAVRVAGDDGTLSTAAEQGRLAGVPEMFPMVAHGRPVGELLVAPRRAGERFSPAEAQLLRDLAGQAALAAEACASAIALQRARDRLVLAREEERRRLRRDLHDGVASALVGTRMLTDVVRRTVPQSGPAPALLDSLAADLDTCTAEVRELIDGLRPAALDDGLGTALDGLIDRFTGQGPEITLVVDGELADLPAAVEVVAYRVVTEALTNVVKHASAKRATVTVRRDERHLEVRVEDNGVGFGGVEQSRRDDGVGLTSIRSRAEEIGGRCEIRSGPIGTSVGVLLALDA